MNNKHILATVFCALCASVTAVVSQIVIPTPFGIPFTLQTLAIALCGYLIGTKYALISTFIYILMGIIGLPVFHGFSGGFAHVFASPTGGFIIGFLPLAAVCGLHRYVKIKRNFLFKFLSGCVGVLLCHIIGVVFYSLYTKIDFLRSFVIVSLPFLLKDIISLLLAFFLADKITNALTKSGYKI